MKLWNLVTKVVLLLAVARLGGVVWQGFSQTFSVSQQDLASSPQTLPVTPKRTQSQSSQSAFDPVTAHTLPTVAKRVLSVRDGLTLMVTDAQGNKATTQTVRLSCLALFPDPAVQKAAKDSLVKLLQTSEGFLYLDDPQTTAPGAAAGKLSREVHLTTGTFLQTELAATGWVQFQTEPGCRAAKTIALVSQRAQQAGLGRWKR